MTDITIPPEAFTAAELAYTEALSRNEDPLRAACLAMLKNWPGVDHQPPQYGDSGPPVLILPLPKEPSDDK
jgi:hypothetical protein